MFSLHIDTARGWRGGQGQVKYTVLGLRQRGDRAVLVAHPDGELFKRMSEGPGPGAAGAAQRGGPGRRLAAVARAQAVRAGRDPGARSRTPWPWPPRRWPSRRRRRSRRSSPRGAWTFTSRTTRSRAGSTAQVDRFIAITNAIADMLVADGIPRAQDRARQRRRGRRADRRAAGGQRPRRVLPAGATRRSSATWRRWCRTRASTT